VRVVSTSEQYSVRVSDCTLAVDGWAVTFDTVMVVGSFGICIQMTLIYRELL